MSEAILKKYIAEIPLERLSILEKLIAKRREKLLSEAREKAEIEAACVRGRADFEAGRTVSIDQVFAEMRQKYQNESTKLCATR